MACAALNSSMASTRSVLQTTRQSFVAALEPMLTWSSCPCDEGIESTDAGMHSPLDWLTIDAAVYCGIIKPLFSPGFATRNLGSSRAPEISL